MKTYAFLLKYAMWALPLACVAMLSSCYNDEYDDCLTTSNDPVPVTVKVSAGAIGDLNGTRVGGDPNAEEHEFINTLHVYVVSHEADNVRRTLMELNTDGLADNALAQEGNLTDWTSETFTLAPGTYMFYAFANIDNYEGQYGDELSSVMGGQFLGDQFIIDDDFTDDNLNSYRLLDPAAEINFGEGKYIPMSAVDTVTVSGDLNASGGIIVDLPLERLVSKVRMTIGENAEIDDYTKASVTFAGYSHNVPLMAGSTSRDYGGRDNDVKQSLANLTTEGSSRTVSFYVNETPDGNPFTVTLNTGSTTGVSEYRATTDCTEIPRNSIYPLTLTFEEDDITLTPMAYLQVTGVPAYDVDYEVDYTTGTYTFGITYGSYLTIEPSVNNMQGMPTFTWNVDRNNPSGMTEGDISDNNSVGLPMLSTGSSLWIFEAAERMMNNDYTLKLNAQWTSSSGVNYNRTYNVIVRISQDYDTVLNGIIDNLSLSANTRGTVVPLSTERLNMVKVK